MRTVPIRDAKAKISALVAAAERGQPATITRRARPAAVLVPVEHALRLDHGNARSFADLLLSFPGGIEFERHSAPLSE